MIVNHNRSHFSAKNICILLSCLLLTATFSVAITAYAYYLQNTNLSYLNLIGVNKLMIVAHPDDESLWTGGELIHNNYLVLCISNGRRGNHKIRKIEFSMAMEFTGNQYILGRYADGVASD